MVSGIEGPFLKAADLLGVAAILTKTETHKLLCPRLGSILGEMRKTLKTLTCL